MRKLLILLVLLFLSGCDKEEKFVEEYLHSFYSLDSYEYKECSGIEDLNDFAACRVDNYASLTSSLEEYYTEDFEIDVSISRYLVNSQIFGVKLTVEQVIVKHSHDNVYTYKLILSTSSPEVSSVDMYGQVIVVNNKVSSHEVTKMIEFTS